ncbi:hypothetical protein BDV97DRAFT_396375 [Delphinella strobiligena]|nr:hypothetical protein BDV97DRAFT_396375 [Delphinella strobiligena]
MGSPLLLSSSGRYHWAVLVLLVDAEAEPLIEIELVAAVTVDDPDVTDALEPGELIVEPLIEAKDEDPDTEVPVAVILGVPGDIDEPLIEPLLETPPAVAVEDMDKTDELKEAADVPLLRDKPDNVDETDDELPTMFVDENPVETADVAPEELGDDVNEPLIESEDEPNTVEEPDAVEDKLLGIVVAEDPDDMIESVPDEPSELIDEPDTVEDKLLGMVVAEDPDDMIEVVPDELTPDEPSELVDEPVTDDEPDGIDELNTELLAVIVFEDPDEMIELEPVELDDELDPGETRTATAVVFEALFKYMYAFRR